MARKPKHGAEKTRDITLTLPPTAVANLDAAAARLGLSRSALVAKIGLGQIAPESLSPLGESLAS